MCLIEETCEGDPAATLTILLPESLIDSDGVVDEVYTIDFEAKHIPDDMDQVLFEWILGSSAVGSESVQVNESKCKICHTRFSISFLLLLSYTPFHV